MIIQLICTGDYPEGCHQRINYKKILEYADIVEVDDES